MSQLVFTGCTDNSLSNLGKVSTGDYVIDLAWSPDSSRLAAVTIGGQVFLLKLDGRSIETRELGNHPAGANAVTWRSDGATFATTGHEGIVKIWEADTGREQASWEVEKSWGSKAEYNPKTKSLAASSGKNIKIWNEFGETIYESSDHESTIADLGWNPDGSGLAVAAYNGLTLHVPGKQSRPRKYIWKGSSLVLSWSPDARYIATGEQDSTVHFWDRRTGEDAQMWGFPNKVLALSWDLTGRWLATSGGRTVSLWDCSGKGPAGRSPVQLEDHQEKVTQLAYQPDGEILASADSGCYLRLWRPMKRHQPFQEARLDSPASCIRWCPGGKVAIGQEDGSILTMGTETIQ